MKVVTLLSDVFLITLYINVSAFQICRKAEREILQAISDCSPLMTTPEITDHQAELERVNGYCIALTEILDYTIENL